MINALKAMLDSIPSFKGSITKQGQILGSMDKEDFDLAIKLFTEYLENRTAL